MPITSSRAAGAQLPTVSVVIPVKNDARLLDRCLDTLAEQLTAPLEILVVDNGSVDDSAAVANAHGVTVLSELAPGIAAASAAGFNRARGDVIARIDADTEVPREWIDVIRNEFSRSDADVITGRATFTDGPRSLRKIAARLYLGAYYGMASLALTHPPVFGSNFAMRRQAWLDVRAEVHDRDSLHDDFDLSYHLGRRHRIRYRSRLDAGISMRPFYDGRGALRIRRGIRTVTVHWPYDLPWLRLTRRIALRARSRRALRPCAGTPAGR